MSNFLLMVQAGLLMFVAAHKKNTTVVAGRSKPDFFSETLLNAMEDAIVLNQCHLPDLKTKDAKDFVNYAVYGTKYAWIEKVLGERHTRPY